jgi:hypothetical protein
VQALTEIEHAMRSFRTSFENGKWVDHCYDLGLAPNYERRIIPDLGSYIGDVLVRSHEGRWTDAPLLMQRRVEIGARLIDPFLVAWKTAYYRHPIVRQLRLLLE